METQWNEAYIDEDIHWWPPSDRRLIGSALLVRYRHIPLRYVSMGRQGGGLGGVRKVALF